MSKYLDEWYDRNYNGYQKAIAERAALHKNSRNLIAFMQDYGVLSSGMSIFEIGCGTGRNLMYVLEAQPDASVAGNDLVKEACFRRMDKHLASVIDFYELDTVSLFRDFVIDVDLLISSDHMMHLDPDSAKKVMVALCESWRPKRIVLRECTKDRFTKDRAARHAHSYSRLKKAYKITARRRSTRHKSYMLYSFLRKDLA